MSLLEVIKDYNDNHTRLRDDLARFGKMELVEAIGSAAMAEEGEDGKRSRHQRYFKKETLQQAREALLAVEDRLRHCSNFDEILTVVEGAVSSITRGPLYVYDVSLKIGACRGHLPEMVYLHRGTREEAEKLGLDTSKKVLEMSAIPAELQRLRACEIEDILCIYKAVFATAVGRSRGILEC
jgi:hypothetical protein